ncbi:MAG: M13 family metallopeptidase [Myxococcales bacterium]|nr:M13 family metallopeptidase [Myxococcales bacterium]
MATMLGLLGDPARAGEEAAAVVALERSIAALGRPRSELRRPEAIYNRVGEAGLAALAPGLAWDAYFAALDLGTVGPALNLTVPEHFAGLDRLLADAPIETLRAYLRWHLLHANAAHLGAPLVAADFELQRALTGLRELPPRAERCTNLANNGGLGEHLGMSFVRRIFPPASKALAETLIAAIEAAFDAGLSELEWMDPLTRGRAHEKTAALRNKVGYPERYRDLHEVTIDDGHHLENVAALQAFVGRRHAGEIGGPVDRREWEMPPAEVNAYYSPTFNEMVFPAGILQPPYFSASWPMAMNFGGIGMVIGHELTHGFDDEGRQFDAKGALREWWEPVAAERFGERAKCIEDAYSAIEVLPGVKVNGALTLGENIADFGGVKLASAGYRRWVAAHGPEPRLLDELSNEQLLYVAFAQGWCSLSSPEITRLLAVVDPHSPPELRVNVPLAHHPGFAEAFACAPGTPMRAPAICEIW